jgi:inosine/xanthosine triphosphate pyrophosphatase family protein
MPLHVVYGTGNPGKVRQVQSALGLYDITVQGISELGVDLDIAEDGHTPEENARKKALAYAAALQRPVLSMDSALYFQDIPAELQPGLHVRRVGGTGRASDEVMITHYIQLIDRFGGRLAGYWETAFALALPDGTCQAHVVKSPRIFVSRGHTEVPEGNPLTALQIDPATGKRLLEMTDEERGKTAYSWGASLAAFLAKTHPEA